MHTNLIIGTMGHIDHGKTSLIAALNGFWGDSTIAEKERGITLDLSFSNLTQGEKNIAFIDVPGHEKLVKNMIAGAFGIDYAMLVIAANEGIMPQTIEHLRIAYLLGITQYIVVLSKCDLVGNSVLDGRKEEITALFSSFKGLQYRILSASIHDKNSIVAIKNTLFSLPKKEHVNLGFFRYYIDRVFTLKGSGCVVSGTLMDGDLSLQDKIWCAQLEQNFSIKNLQSHGKNTEIAHNGARVAINLGGISHHNLKRGDLLTKKGYLRGFDKVEVELESFENIEHNSEVMLYLGALRTNCRVLLLDSNKKFATLKTKTLLFSIFDERFILRDDNKTLGGGRILSPIVDPMKKSQKLEYLKLLSNGDFKGAFNILLQAHKRGFGLISAIQRFRISQSKALEIAREIPHCFVCEKELIAYPKTARELVKDVIANILTKNPNALLSAALLSQKQSFIAERFALDVLNELLEQKALHRVESFFVAPENSANLGDAQDVENYLYVTIYNTLHSQDYEPIAPYNLYDSLDIDRKSGDMIFKRLTREKKILRLSHKLFICTEHLTKLLELMRSIIAKEGYLDINNFKKHLNLSRKYLITYLDYLDSFSDIQNNNGKRTLK
ncbi:selenocysteine-specific translation elongation factor [Helicobacter turcicus]|uniref:Selenocysteine-specific translation elongation factor n=1 Tax=Helicobacter turcicus TaxID=2867412 RepID=A0ABS7JM72_9HELI|nr:selenocysteine-specific translation elongation factor [Helicobacter turcicus]MBX7490476.1 selenocysteine-specific translation elongation factor [Helicobacter turcicus]MBX7545336.1 selenocysteine-specific translation elongation factor [Helicobacter turcicus]